MRKFQKLEHIGITPEEESNTDILLENIKMNELQNRFENILQFKYRELLAPGSYGLCELNKFYKTLKKNIAMIKKF